MKSFSQHIQEMAMKPSSVTPEEIQSIIDQMSPYKSQPIVWRGLKGPGMITISTPTPEMNFYGASSPVVKEVIDKMFDTRPVFATQAKHIASLFAAKHNGSLYAWVPSDHFKIVWNPNVTDLLVDTKDSDNASEIVKGYKSTSSVENFGKSELLIQEPESKFISIASIINLMHDHDYGMHPLLYEIYRKQDIKNITRTNFQSSLIDKINTYSDLIILLEALKKFLTIPSQKRWE